MIKHLTALVAAALFACAPAAAQKVSTLPAASTLTGAEKLAAAQGSGCATQTTPCATVAVTPAQIATYVGTTYQAVDADLTLIAALTTTSTGRDLLTATDPAAIRAKAGTIIGTNVQAWDADLDSLAAATATGLYYRSSATTWSPVTIGSNLTFTSGTLAATGGGTGGSGTVTSFAFTNGAGVTGTVTNSTTTPTLALSLGAITPSSVAATGTVAGSNITTAGNTTGNAATATRLATARTIAGQSFDGTANITIADTALTGAAWTTFTPTASCATGALTTATTTGRYKLVGKTVFLQIKVAITTNGSCGGAVNIAGLPLIAGGVTGAAGMGDSYMLVGRETLATGYTLNASIAAGTTSTQIFRYDAGYPGGSGYTLQLSGIYEAQ